MSEALETIVTERAGIELQRMAERELLKDTHRAALKEFDDATRKLLVANRLKYAAALRAP